MTFIVISLTTFAQTDAVKNYQLASPRVSKAFSKFDTQLAKAFKEKGLNYPAENLLLRSFKAQNELEIWAKNNDQDTFTLFKTYKVCALSGQLGPKRYEGDRQVPEGLYFISNFNPNSDFHLSMLVNYPNYSDMILTQDQKRPGGDIYIHGGCLTVGCLPMTDEGIQEIYTLCLNTYINGETNIPVQIFPTRFDRTGLNFLGREYKSDVEKQKFWINLKTAYDYFEKYRKILPVMYNQEGKYLF